MSEASREVIDTGTTHLLASLSQGVLTLTLNRPEARNAMSGEMNAALAAMPRRNPSLLCCPQ